jgi:hypothetical protein
MEPVEEAVLENASMRNTRCEICNVVLMSELLGNHPHQCIKYERLYINESHPHAHHHSSMHGHPQTHWFQSGSPSLPVQFLHECS